MKDSLILEGKIYISARRASRIMNYAQDYIGQLCRTGKLECKMIGRSWFVTEESLLSHRESAIESTEERVLKIIEKDKEELTKNIQEKIKEENTREKQTVCKIESSPLEYHVEEKPLLPPLGKRVSPAFAIPSFHFDARKASTANTAFIVLFIAAMGMSALIYSTSLKSVSPSSSTASVASVTRDIVDQAMSTVTKFVIDRLPENKTKNEEVKATETQTENKFNGIGIVPSTSPLVDEKEKNMIRNSFSDEVRINPDQSGTAGVITPVFKKTDGKDFVYVLVPVKDNKQQ